MFRDRTDAGRQLAARLTDYHGRGDLLVLALPRGGVPVGYEVARELDAPLEAFIVRKLGVPGHEELAMGAIASGGVLVLDERVIQSLGISQRAIDEVIRREREELERREAAYRDSRPQPIFRDRCLLLIDDGIATGSTIQAGAMALRQQEPARVVIAVPVVPPSTAARLQAYADDLVAVAMPEPFLAVGQWYDDFAQTSDQEVRELLNRAWQEHEHRSTTS